MDKALETAVSDLSNTRYLTFAALTILLYDHVITIVDEVSLIWPAQNGPIKMVFLFNRYTVPLVIMFSSAILSGDVSFLNDKNLYTFPLTDQFCQAFVTFTVCYEVVALLSTTFVVTTRVYALWGTQRHSFTFLAGLWGAHFIADIIVVSRSLMVQLPRVFHEPNFNVCYNTNVAGNWIVWLNGILFNAIMIMLLMWAWLATPRNVQTPLMALIVRDGCIYFVAIFAAMLFNLLIWKYGRATQAVLPFFAVWSTTTIALSRLLLSMKDVQGPEDWGLQAKITVPDLELSPMQNRGPIGVISRFSEDEDGDGDDVRPITGVDKKRLAPKMTHLGRYEYA